MKSNDNGNGQPGQARQGDVLLTPLSQKEAETILANMNWKDDVHADNIVAMGEGTGHNHVITGMGAVVIVIYGMMYAHVPNGGALVHESGDHPDHDPIQLLPGTYGVTRQLDNVGTARQSYVRD